MRRGYSGNARRASLTYDLGGTTGDIIIQTDGLDGWYDGPDPQQAVIGRGTALEEKVLVTYTSTNVLTVYTDGEAHVWRAADGTAIAAHLAGTTIEHVHWAMDDDESNAHIEAEADVHGIVGNPETRLSDLETFQTGATTDLADLQTQVDAKEPLLPSRTGHVGHYLRVGLGEVDEWHEVDGGTGLPSAVDQEGAVLGNDGIDPMWQRQIEWVNGDATSRFSIDDGGDGQLHVIFEDGSGFAQALVGPEFARLEATEGVTEASVEVNRDGTVTISGTAAMVSADGKSQAGVGDGGDARIKWSDGDDNAGAYAGEGYAALYLVKDGSAVAAVELYDNGNVEVTADGDFLVNGAPVGGGGAEIDDGTPASDKVWSSFKTDGEISSRVSALVAGAPGALDTLDELAAALADDAAFATTVTNALADKVAKSMIDAKGDLFVGTGDNAVARLAAAADGKYLKTKSSAATGLEWGDALAFYRTSIPKMTSATAPSGTASNSTNYNSSTAAWNAMKRDGGAWLTDGTALPQWLQYEYATAKTAIAYGFRNWFSDTGATRGPTAWTFAGSNDGSSWTTLSTVSGHVWYEWPDSGYIFMIASPASYKYYRLTVSANGGNTYTGLADFRIFTSEDPTALPIGLTKYEPTVIASA